jgi:hypothetical protein
VDDQRGAIHREKFARLQVEFDELIKLGAAGPEDFRTVCFRMLKGFENTRLKNHSQIQKLKEEIAFCEATARACDMFEGLLIGLISSYRADKAAGLETPRVRDEDGKEVISDTDMLKTICICGCQDDEDRSTCKCVCHQGIPCGKSNCVVCAAKALIPKSDNGKSVDVMDRPDRSVEPSKRKPRRVKA